MVHTDSPIADQVLDALGHQTRRHILALLKQGPLAVGAIADQLPISRPAVSRHLRLLKNAGLVADHVEGTRNIYHLRAEAFDDVQAALRDLWGNAAARFRLAAENLDGDLRGS